MRRYTVIISSEENQERKLEIRTKNFLKIMRIVRLSRKLIKKPFCLEVFVNKTNWESERKIMRRDFFNQESNVSQVFTVN